MIDKLISEPEIERSVRERLYGRRTSVEAQPRDSAAAGGLVGGRYRLLERVGIGGMGTVYRARDERLKRDVAVKVIAEHLAANTGFMRRFAKEAELCARLAHPNIVAVLDAGKRPRVFIVMEFVDGLNADMFLRAQ